MLNRFIVMLVVIISLATHPARALPLPLFEDLQPKWSQITVGMTVEEVVAKIGAQPSIRIQANVLYVEYEDLEWSSFNQFKVIRFRARFLHGRLISKSIATY